MIARIVFGALTLAAFVAAWAKAFIWAGVI